MPIYEYRCEICGASQDAVRKIDKRHDSPPCDECKVATNLIISPVRGSVVADIQHFDNGLNMPITSAKQLAYERDKRGLIDAREAYGGTDMPNLPPPEKRAKQQIPGELYDSMKREGKSAMLANVEIEQP